MEEMYDIHCHILPGVDDGAGHIGLSLEMLKAEKDSGVRTIILTPHYRRRMFEPSVDLIRENFETLQKEAAGLGLDLYLGCEYHANMDMVENLQEGRRPTLAGSRFVLSEFKEDSPAEFIRERTMALLNAGYTPVIAHFERYKALRSSTDLVEELYERGCRMQMNADCITGRDGFFMARFAKKMAQYDLISYVASDCHDMGRRAPHLAEAAKVLEKWGGVRYAEHILCDNPREIIEG